MKTLKSFMIDMPPISAMPYKKHLNKIEMAAKIGKRIPHPVVQKISHAADLTVKVVKQVDKLQEKTGSNKRTSKIFKPE
jgi:hypothetical protein